MNKQFHSIIKIELEQPRGFVVSLDVCEAAVIISNSFLPPLSLSFCVPKQVLK